MKKHPSTDRRELADRAALLSLELLRLSRELVEIPLVTGTPEGLEASSLSIPHTARGAAGPHRAGRALGGRRKGNR